MRCSSCLRTQPNLQNKDAKVFLQKGDRVDYIRSTPALSLSRYTKLLEAGFARAGVQLPHTVCVLGLECGNEGEPESVPSLTMISGLITCVSVQKKGTILGLSRST